MSQLTIFRLPVDPAVTIDHTKAVPTKVATTVPPHMRRSIFFTSTNSIATKQATTPQPFPYAANAQGIRTYNTVPGNILPTATGTTQPFPGNMPFRKYLLFKSYF